jgi:hypothetical protein
MDPDMRVLERKIPAKGKGETGRRLTDEIWQGSRCGTEFQRCLLILWVNKPISLGILPDTLVDERPSWPVECCDDLKG